MSGPATVAVYKGSEICEQFKSSETFHHHEQFFKNRQDADAKYGELTKEVGSQLAMQF